MDLESDRSALASVEDDELVATEGLEKKGETETKLKGNGEYHDDNVDSKLVDDIKVEDTVGSSTSPATKGQGLRKWRRIRREAGKDTNSSLDSNRKRGLTALPVMMKQRSDGSSSSTNAMVNTLGNNTFDHTAPYGDSGHSENSEDRNSRSSSTAASAPRVKNEMPVVNLGLDMNMMNLRGKNLGVSVQNSDQQEKNRNGNSKKARGVKIKKENSYSSMESDSRSSNFVFAQGGNSVTSNGRQSGRSGNYDEEYSDDAQNGDKHLNEEEEEDVSQEDLAAENSWEIKEEKIDDHVGSMNRDALVESIIPLHSVQEALEREVRKLRDVGKEEPLSSDDSGRPSGSSSVDSQGNDPKQNVLHLERKLEEARVKISELESTLNFEDMETELEELLKQRIEAEVEYLVILKSTQNMKVGPIDRIKLIVQQKNIEDATFEKKQVWKYASCFTIQFVLLLVVLYLFILKFSSQTIEVVPT